MRRSVAGRMQTGGVWMILSEFRGLLVLFFDTRRQLNTHLQRYPLAFTRALYSYSNHVEAPHARHPAP